MVTGPFTSSSVKVATTSLFVGSTVLYSTLAVGASLSIFVTYTVAEPSFPTASTNVNVNSPFSVKVKVSLPPLFVIVTGPFASSSTIFAVTSPLVGSTVLYSNIAVGAIVSRIMLSLISAILSTPVASLYFTYTVFSPSPGRIVYVAVASNNSQSPQLAPSFEKLINSIGPSIP